MPILSSTATIDAHAQADGRHYVRERHTDHNGRTYDVEYLADAGLDTDLVMSLRAANIGQEIDAREAAEAEASNFTLPIPKIDWTRRFTMAERIAIRQAAKTDPVIEDILELLAAVSTGVLLSDADTQMALGYFAQQGLITSERAAEIGAA
jgi:hypothetical protein